MATAGVTTAPPESPAADLSGRLASCGKSVRPHRGLEAEDAGRQRVRAQEADDLLKRHQKPDPVRPELVVKKDPLTTCHLVRRLRTACLDAGQVAMDTVPQFHEPLHVLTVLLPFQPKRIGRD